MSREGGKGGRESEAVPESRGGRRKGKTHLEGVLLGDGLETTVTELGCRGRKSESSRVTFEREKTHKKYR